jgi:hypothetical protein
MTIQFQCDCGQALAARDDYAGKRVRCTGCGNIIAAPNGSSARRPAVTEPTPQPAAGEMIRFQCACGQTCQASPEHAGRKTRCPKCGEVVSIPGGAAGGVTAAPRAVPMAAVAQNPDEDFRNEDERPSRNRRGAGKKGFPWLWVGLGTGVVAAGVAVALWFLLGGSSASADFDPVPRDDQSFADFDLVPRDAQGFVTFRVADALKTDVGKAIWEQVRAKGGNELDVMQEKTGMKPEDIDRVTIVSVDAQKESMWVIVNTNKAYDRDKLIKEGNLKESSHNGGKYYTMRPDTAVIFVSDRQAVFGPEKGIKRCLELPKKPASGPLDKSLKVASNSKYHFAAGAHIPQDLADQARGVSKGIPLKVDSLLALKGATLTGIFKDNIELEARLQFPDSDKAKSAESDLNTLKGLLGMAAAQDKTGLVNKLNSGLTIKQDGSEVVVGFTVDSKTILDASKNLPGGGGRKVGGVGGVGGARGAARNNFQQLALAMVNYADSHQGNFVEQAGAIPPNAVKHSWRVHLLPYIEQNNLYKQIHLNEAWDSPWNKQFHGQMPKTFEFPGRPAPRGMTYVQVVYGPGTAFPGGGRKMRFPASFQDGTSQTIVLVEAARAVNWMQPEDINFQQVRGPLSFKLGTHPGATGPLVGLGDGSVQFLKTGISDKTLRAAISPANSDVLGRDW